MLNSGLHLVKALIVQNQGAHAVMDSRVRSVLEPSWQPFILRLAIFCRKESKQLVMVWSYHNSSMELAIKSFKMAEMEFKRRLENLHLYQGPPLSLWDPVQLYWHHQGHTPFAPSALNTMTNTNCAQCQNRSQPLIAKCADEWCSTDGQDHRKRQTFHSYSSGHTFGFLIRILHKCSNWRCCKKNG